MKILLILLSLVGLACGMPEKKKTKSLDDVMPVTLANLEGHKSLYNEGWMVITSTDKALNYAHEKSIKTSGAEIRKAAAKIGQHTDQIKNNSSQILSQSKNHSAEVFKFGTALSGGLVGGGVALSERQIEFSKENYIKAWDRITLGNLSLVQRSEDDYNKLKSLPNNTYEQLRKDFQNIEILIDRVNKKIDPHIESNWPNAFNEARSAFMEEYENSGKANNSLGGLGYIFKGYFRSAKDGVVVPAAKTMAWVSVKTGEYVVFLPLASTLMVVGRTVPTVGKAIYYTGKLGVHIVAPTIESGFLASMATLSAATAPVPAIAGTSAGVINQVAFTGAAGATAAGYAVGKSALEGSKYVGMVTYEFATGASKVIYHQASSGVVLGYNALVAIPAHTLMGVVDSVIFLAWEGPKLVLVSAKGYKIVRGKKVPLQNMPVGTVVDIDKLEGESNIDVKKLEVEPEILHKIIEEAPKDFRERKTP